MTIKEIFNKEGLEEHLKNKIDKLGLKSVSFKGVSLRNGAHLVIKVFGGFNGINDGWVNYLKQIEKILEQFNNPWVLKLENDAIDDLWYLEFGCYLHENKDLNKFYNRKKFQEFYDKKEMPKGKYLIKLGKDSYDWYSNDGMLNAINLPHDETIALTFVKGGYIGDSFDSHLLFGASIYKDIDGNPEFFSDYGNVYEETEEKE